MGKHRIHRQHGMSRTVQQETVGSLALARRGVQVGFMVVGRPGTRHSLVRRSFQLPGSNQRDVIVEVP